MIEEILSSGSIRRRLLDLGFCEGTVLRCVQSSPAGDPIAYLVRGTVIALRKEDAANILVREGEYLWD